MKRWWKSLTFWVLAGAAIGYLASLPFDREALVAAGDQHGVYGFVRLVKTLFIRSLFVLVAPVVFFSLLAGVVHLGDGASMRRLGGLTLAYYLATTAIAVAIGLVAVFMVQPWGDIPAGAAAGIGSSGASAYALPHVQPQQWVDLESGTRLAIARGFLLSALQNPFAALAQTQLLAIVVCALLCGLAALAALPRGSPWFAVVRDCNAIVHKVLGWVILAAPLGVGAIVFEFSVEAPGTLFRSVARFAGLVFGATALHGLVVLPALAWGLGGTSPRRLLRAFAQPGLVALSTASSAATLPVTLRACEEELDIDPAVSSFVCPLGATMNMDGTALFEGIAAVFLAHLYGIELSTAGIVAIFAMAMVSSIGAPGMPSGSMAGMQMVLLAAGIPLEGIGILLAIERPLDTFRTAVNVEGDMVGALVVQRMARRGAAGAGAAARPEGGG